MHTFSDSFFDVHGTKHPLDIIEFPDKYIIFIEKSKKLAFICFKSISERAKLSIFHPRALDLWDVKYSSDMETRNLYFFIA